MQFEISTLQKELGEKNKEYEKEMNKIKEKLAQTENALFNKEGLNPCFVYVETPSGELLRFVYCKNLTCLKLKQKIEMKIKISVSKLDLYCDVTKLGDSCLLQSGCVVCL